MFLKDFASAAFYSLLWKVPQKIKIKLFFYDNKFHVHIVLKETYLDNEDMVYILHKDTSGIENWINFFNSFSELQFFNSIVDHVQYFWL